MADLTAKYTPGEWSSLVMGEALLFGLLGRVLNANPSHEWIDPLLENDLFDSVPFADAQEDMVQGLDLLAGWSAALDGALTDAALRDLRVDYARLFIGDNPMRVPPWESVYFNQNRLTFQAETLDVHHWFERMGVRINSDTRAPDDHIAFELSFIAHCAERAYHARLASDGGSAAFATLLAEQRAFLEQHLLRWGIKWADLAHEHAQTDFYRGLALMVRGGLKELALVLDVNIPQDITYPGIDGR